MANIEFIDVARALYEGGTLKTGEFVLSSGQKSSRYWFIPNLKSATEQRNVIISVYQQMLGQCNFDCLADVPWAPSFIVDILSDRLQVPMVTPREPKDHGFITEVEGTYKRGDIAVVIEGVLTTGGSVLSAIKRLETNGLVVKDVVGLIDAEEGARENLASYNVHVFTTHNRLIEFLTH